MRFISRDSCDQPRNFNYEKDIVYVTKHNKWVLNSIGIWPAVLKGIGKFLPKIAIGICNLALFFGIIPCILHIIFDEKDTVVRLKLSGLLLFCVCSLMKHWALTSRKSTIRDCIEQVRTDWKQVKFNKDREMMLKYGRVGRNLTLLCAVFMYTGGFTYHTILQYGIGTFIDENNQTVRPLIYPTYSAFYNVQVTPVYQVVYIAHCVCGYVIYSITVGACGLAALFVTHTCGQIDIVISRLNELIHGNWTDNTSTLNRRLVEIVESHLRILRFSATVDTILQEVCLLESVSSTFLICLLEYYVITDWKQSTLSVTTYIVLLVSLTFNIFILCYIGEILMEKSGSIGLSCFMIDWYKLPTKTAPDLLLIMAMSNNPVKITAGRVINLSLSTFGSILKTSLAYLSFLRNTVR